MNISPKKLYEKIVLSGYRPTAEEVKSIKGTHWYNKLYGEESKNPYSAFKYFYKEDNSSSKVMDRFQLADYILDKIEDQYGLHFSSSYNVEHDETKLSKIKKFIMELLGKCKSHLQDKSDVAKRVQRAEDISELLILLNMISKNPLE